MKKFIERSLNTLGKIRERWTFASKGQLRRVLIADNEEDFLFIFERILRYAPFLLVQAKNGAEALELIREQRIDIAFVDIRMPIMDGFQLLNEVRKSSEPHIRSMPVVAITSFSGDEMAQQLLAAGFNACLFKPFEKEQILQILERFSSKQQHPWWFRPRQTSLAHKAVFNR